MAFTIDAGPNIHLLYPSHEKSKVDAFIKDECSNLLEKNFFIHDSIGVGSIVKSVNVDGKDYEIF